MTIKSIDQHQFKITVATAIIVFIFIITMSVQVATWKAEMMSQHKEFDDRITHVGEKVIETIEDVELLNARANNRDIELATINTKLANIEALLIEIKIDLKELN